MHTTEKQLLNPKQAIINFVEVEPFIVWNFYDDDDGYLNIEILFASEAALINLLNRKPNYIAYHINAYSNHFEFFIDKDVEIYKSN